MERNDVLFTIRCIKKFSLKSQHLVEPLETILGRLNFDHEDIAFLLQQLVNDTNDEKLVEQLSKSIEEWEDVPAIAPVIPDIEPVTDSPV